MSKRKHSQDFFRLVSHCILKVIDRTPGEKAISTGFIITDDGYILTCFHVLPRAVREGRSQNVEVEYNGQRMTARHIPRYSNPDKDIAVLKLDGKGFPTLPLSFSWAAGDDVLVVGFQEQTTFPQGRPVDAQIDFHCPIAFKDGLLQDCLVLTFKNIRIEEGASGAPIFNTSTGKVTGIATGTKRREILGRAIPSRRRKGELEIEVIDFSQPLGFGILLSDVCERWPEFWFLASESVYLLSWEDRKRTLTVSLFGRNPKDRSTCARLPGHISASLQSTAQVSAEAANEVLERSGQLLADWLKSGVGESGVQRWKGTLLSGTPARRKLHCNSELAFAVAHTIELLTSFVSEQTSVDVLLPSNILLSGSLRHEDSGWQVECQGDLISGMPLLKTILKPGDWILWPLREQIPEVSHVSETIEEDAVELYPADTLLAGLEPIFTRATQVLYEEANRLRTEVASGLERYHQLKRDIEHLKARYISEIMVPSELLRLAQRRRQLLEQEYERLKRAIDQGELNEEELTTALQNTLDKIDSVHLGPEPEGEEEVERPSTPSSSFESGAGELPELDIGFTEQDKSRIKAQYLQTILRRWHGIVNLPMGESASEADLERWQLRLGVYRQKDYILMHAILVAESQDWCLNVVDSESVAPEFDLAVKRVREFRQAALAVAYRCQMLREESIYQLRDPQTFFLRESQRITTDLQEEERAVEALKEKIQGLGEYIKARHRAGAKNKRRRSR